MKPPPDHRSPSGRYQTDPVFAGIVDLLESYIHAAKLTPHELREAAGLAAFHAVMRAPMGPHIHFLQALTSNAPPVGPPPVVLVDGLPYRLDANAEHPDSQRAVDAMRHLESVVRTMRRDGIAEVHRDMPPQIVVRVPVSNDEPESET